MKRIWWMVFGATIGLLTATVLAQVIQFACTTCIFPGPVRVPAGTSGTPSLTFTGDIGTGFYDFSAGIIGYVGSIQPATDATYDLGGASNRIRNIYLSGTIAGSTSLFGDGTSGAPSIAFASQTTLGFYKQGSGIIGVAGNLAPSADATYDLGAGSSPRWRNGLFTGLVAGNEVQIGAGAGSTSNGQLRNDGVGGFLNIQATGVLLGDLSNYAGMNIRAIDVEGIQLDPTYGDAQPACSSSVRGVLWFLTNGTGVADQLQVCGKTADGLYLWLTLQ